jgi:hypothetical protein
MVASAQEPSADLGHEDEETETYRDPLDTRDATGKPIPQGSDLPAPAAPPPLTAADRLLWGGEFHFGMELEDSLSSGEAGAGLEVRARTPEREGLFVQAEAGLAHDDEGVKVREMFLGRRYVDGQGDSAEARAGFQKKLFGRYDHVDGRDRVPAAKPVVYDSLDEFSYSGREIRLARIDASASSLDTQVSVGSGSATNFNLLAFVGELSREARLQWGAWGLLQAQRYREKREPVWSLAAMLGSQGARTSWVLEAVMGKDPFETDWERTFKKKQTQVVFWSGSIEAGFHALTGEGWRLSPYLLGSYFVPRQSMSSKNTTQAAAGLRWERGPLRAAFEVDARGTTRQDKDERSWKSSRGKAEASYAF